MINLQKCKLFIIRKNIEKMKNKKNVEKNEKYWKKRNVGYFEERKKEASWREEVVVKKKK